MSDKTRQLDSRTRLLVWGGFFLTFTVILGLWLILLPGQLKSAKGPFMGLSLWDGLNLEKETATANWQEAKGSIIESWGAIKERVSQGEPPPTDTVPALAPAQQEEIKGFSQRLESAVIEEEQANAAEVINAPLP
jgi:hypothetical protein